jgi:hypothetical protein
MVERVDSPRRRDRYKAYAKDELMFDPAAYKGQTLPRLLADLDRLGDFALLPKDVDWHLVDRLAGGVAPDPERRIEAIGELATANKQ